MMAKFAKRERDTRVQGASVVSMRGYITLEFFYDDRCTDLSM
jgi:hypothetical protein